MISRAKGGARSFTRTVICADKIWSLLPARARKANYLHVQRRERERVAAKEAAAKIERRGVVLDGPFAGMLFSSAETRGSAHFPRLLGCYESELHETVRTFSHREYSAIVDIGFAEGYYLVGLGLINKKALLIGFDTDPVAHRQCRALAEKNGIGAARLILHGEFSHQLAASCLPAQSLVICDCEGFEINIFNDKFQALWQQSDLIIECHDFLREGISSELIGRLESTHTVKIVRTNSDDVRISFTQRPELSVLALEDRAELVSEGRPAAQIWIIAEPKLAN